MKESGPAATQNVSATAGFAYGVIGADLYVQADGTPSYLIEQYAPPPPPDHTWLRALPSRMLSARSHVVPFTGRQKECEELVSWLDRRERLAVRWLHGMGGQGKTRLAERLAEYAVDNGWKVVTAAQAAGRGGPSPGSQDLRPDGCTGILLVVDYADRWALSQLTWLLRNSLLHHDGLRTRVLLLGRTTGGWGALQAVLEDPRTPAVASEQRLGPLPQSHGWRRAMFEAARNRFSEIYGLPDPSSIQSPIPLSHDDFGLTLTVHLAALAAVDAVASASHTPTDPRRLTGYLLAREQQQWALLYEQAQQGLDYRTPPSVMARTAFTVALAGRTGRSDAMALFGRIEAEEPADRLMADYWYCYPPPGSPSEAALEPLQPDRLAEDFLGMSLCGRSDEEAAPAWAAARLSDVIAAASPKRRRWGRAPRTAPFGLGRAIIFLAATAARWPRVASDHLFPLLRADPRLAYTAGSASLTAIVDIQPRDFALLETLHAMMPKNVGPDLEEGVAALTEALAEHRLAAAGTPAERALIHRELSVAMVQAGRFDAAVSAAESAARILEHAIRADPGVRPDMAATLGVLGMALSKVGNPTRALETTRAAARLTGELSAAHPNLYAVAHGKILTNLGMMQAHLGHPNAALDAYSEALRIFVCNAGVGSEAAEYQATIYGNMGAALAQLDRAPEALDMTQKAVKVYRTLARSDPAKYEHWLARYLGNLGGDLSDVGRLTQALQATREAVELFRKLSSSNPLVYVPDFASALINLAVDLAGVGRRAEALETAREAISLYRRLTEHNGPGFERDLARGLHNLAPILAEDGRPGEAITAIEEAVAIYRKLMAAYPTAFRRALAESLLVFGRILSLQGRNREAGKATREAERLFGMALRDR